MAKASDNVFPYVHVAPAAAPSSPSAGSQRLYLDSADGNKLKRKDSSGTVVTIEGGGGSALTVQDENGNVSTSVTQLDFQGAGVTATAGTGEVIVTIPTPTFSPTWTSWTPTLTAVTTNPTLGSGSSADGRYMQIGKLVIALFTIQFGSSGTNPGSGEYRLSLPVNAETANMTVGPPMGSASGFAPAGAFSALRVSASTVRFWNNGTYLGSGSGWSAGSQIWGVLTYEAA